MSVKIWHQSFTVLGDLGAYNVALEEHFARVARPDTEIHLHGMQPGTYRTNYPGDDIKHIAMQHLHGLQFMAAGICAEEEGYDAYALSTLPEPALHEIRSMLDIPVVGYSEAAMLTACTLGRTFGVMVFIDALKDLVPDIARGHGLGDRLAAVRHAGIQFGDVLEAFDDPEPLLERFRQSARELIAAGAEVIIPGEAPLNVLLARSGISEVDGIPVLDSLGAWIKQAESMVDLQRAGGLQPCRTGYYAARPDRERLKEVFRFYGMGDLLPAS